MGVNNSYVCHYGSKEFESNWKEQLDGCEDEGEGGGKNSFKKGKMNVKIEELREIMRLLQKHNCSSGAKGGQIVSIIK